MVQKPQICYLIQSQAARRSLSEVICRRRRSAAIKVVDQTVLVVGYCSGETVFYCMADFKVLSKSKEHTASISAMESGKLCLPDSGGMISNFDVLMTEGNEADQTNVIWDISNITPMKRLRGHNHMITAIVDLGDCGTIMIGAMAA